MFWGCISEHGTGPLITIDGTMDGEQYLTVLKEWLLPELEIAQQLFDGNWQIMQDNAPCHRTLDIREYLAERNVPILDWPPYSPDLNTIENIWNWMKSKMPPVSSQNELTAEFLKIWDSITPEMCANYCSNYDRRLKAVKEAKGRATKY